MIKGPLNQVGGLDFSVQIRGILKNHPRELLKYKGLGHSSRQSILIGVGLSLRRIIFRIKFYNREEQASLRKMMEERLIKVCLKCLLKQDLKEVQE